MIPEEMQKDLQAWLDGELPPGRMAELSLAVARDALLGVRVEELRAVEALLLEHPEMALPEGFAGRVARGASSSRGGRPGSSWWQRPWMGAALAASLLVALVLVLGPWTSRGKSKRRVSKPASTAPLDPALASQGETRELEELVDAMEWVDREYLALNN